MAHDGFNRLNTAEVMLHQFPAWTSEALAESAFTLLGSSGYLVRSGYPAEESMWRSQRRKKGLDSPEKERTAQPSSIPASPPSRHPCHPTLGCCFWLCLPPVPPQGLALRSRVPSVLSIPGLLPGGSSASTSLAQGVLSQAGEPRWVTQPQQAPRGP